MSGPFDAAAAARQCSRPDCSERAGVTLTYEYARSQVWLDELGADRDPHAYDLCRRHAARLSVPQGWRVADRRVAASRRRPDDPTSDLGDLSALLAG